MVTDFGNDVPRTESGAIAAGDPFPAFGAAPSYEVKNLILGSFEFFWADLERKAAVIVSLALSQLHGFAFARTVESH